ncbi:MAG: sugar phosphate isomerase/epimerase [Saprospiraceae bacterium]|nr:sugar phosphate isomerase/epimerase [Saprospiraceae bacterium]
MKISRSSFLQLLASGAVAPAIAYVPFRKIDTLSIEPALNDALGMASYTLRKFTIDEVISVVNKLGIKHLALKSMHMPLDSSDADIQSIATKVRNAGIDLYGAGVIYMKTADEVRNAFRYAKAASIGTIIGVPNHELLPLSNELVQQYDIKLAIHNHGPGDELYPSPQSIMDRIKDLDDRVGVCLDIGHAVRIGLDVATETKRCAGRLYDVHLKDVNVAAAEGGSVEMGRGILDIPTFLKTLKSIDYQGVLGLEYEKDADDPMLGLAESVGFARGVMRMI